MSKAHRAHKRSRRSSTPHEDAARPSSLSTEQIEAPHYPEVEKINWPYKRIIDKRMAGDKAEYMVVWRSSWIPEDLIRPRERGLEEGLAEGPGGPPSAPPNNPLSSSSNVYGENTTMSLANMPTSNMNPVMLQHSQLPRFPFDPAVPQSYPVQPSQHQSYPIQRSQQQPYSIQRSQQQPYPVQPSQQHPPISPHNNQAPESEVSDLMNHIAELAQTQLGSSIFQENGDGGGTSSPLMQPAPLIDIPYQHTHNGSFESFDWITVGMAE
ncbi:hypothetical protein WR25_13161 [Diploscapter pachys]|uniref:Chromo domain-containing protein n=1 Tax=Diploscapter pachys TaxID=2018661 RepID=A0A2A2LQ00_9BILA|nr:hypothetical protein WR25_13161 [Diploscapter pachys]